MGTALVEGARSASVRRPSRLATVWILLVTSIAACAEPPRFSPAEDPVRAVHEELRRAYEMREFGSVWDGLSIELRAEIERCLARWDLDPPFVPGLACAKDAFVQQQSAAVAAEPVAFRMEVDLLRSLEPYRISIQDERATVACEGAGLGVPALRLEYGREGGRWRLLPGSVLGEMLWPRTAAYILDPSLVRDPLRIRVIAQRWSWQFEYGNGWIDDRLRVPTGRPVEIVVTSSSNLDHRLEVPQFGLKVDALPGCETTACFLVKAPGRFPLVCGAYCGPGHAEMISRVIAEEPAVFERWLADTNSLDRLEPAEAGARLVELRGCLVCHSTDGSRGFGPTFLGILGRTRPDTDGAVRTIDPAFVRESIFRPGAEVAGGFDDIMPTYAGRLSEDHLASIVAYLRTLSAAD